jgi:hypothetical protein
MSLFRRDPTSPLGDELRRARPKPRTEFAQGLAARIERQIPSRIGLRLRIGVAVALTVVFSAVAASVGGVGYAAAAASHAVKAVEHAFTPTKADAIVPKASVLPKAPTPSNTNAPSNNNASSNGNTSSNGNAHNENPHPGKGNGGDDNGNGDDNGSPGDHQYKKVFMCHEDHTIRVAPDDVPAHLAAGDVLGKCHGKDKK